MAGKKRSGLANDRRAYGCSRYCPITQVVPITLTYTLTYDGNNSTGGFPPVDVLSPYNSGSQVTILGNTGLLVRSGFAFSTWSDGTNFLGVGDSFTINQNIILYAEWAEL